MASRSSRGRDITGFEGMEVLAADDNQVKRKARSSRSAKLAQDAEKSLDLPVGDALRSIYQQTVDEDIPKEFLDILGKLA